jgi:RimJ/RimL family protein N-acetyltransferase
LNQGLVLETERLALHPLSEADLDALHRISNEPLVRLYLWDDVPVSMVQIEGILEQSVREFAKKGLGLFGIRLRGEAKLLDVCCAITQLKRFAKWRSGRPSRLLSTCPQV